MIRVVPGPVPKELDGPDSPGGAERTEAITFFADRKNKEQGFEFKAYKEVGDSLVATFGRKCAYCESEYAAVHPVDIEHYRPKSGYKLGKKLVKPGYYWLGAEWMNLLPSCIDCNRKRYHEFPGEGPHQRGKENLFPISDESKRAMKPGEEKGEARLLLHPYLDEPSEHLEFRDDGSIKPRVKAGQPSEIGRQSIEVYGLDRPVLSEVRRDHLVQVQGSMEQIKTLQEALDEIPQSAATARAKTQRALDAEIERLRKLLERTQRYSAASAQVAEEFFKQVSQ